MCNQDQLRLSPKLTTSSKTTFQPPSQLFSSSALSFSYNSTTLVSENKPTPNLYNLWHNRLSHPSFQVVKTILSQCNIHVNNKNTFEFCSACCFSKIHNFSFFHSNTIYSSHLELVHTDLLGPSHSPLKNGYNYYVSFVDAHSRYTWLYLIRHKSDALQTFKNFKTQVELQLGCKIKALQYDWAGEFRVFRDFLTQCGIIVHRNSCRYAHQQNGVVDRKHRHIVENGLTLLAQASLPIHYWDEAVRTAVYIYNILPTPVLHSKSPIEVLLHAKPDYSMLKTFGCSCYPNIRPFSRHKLDFRSVHCIFLGCSLNHKVYKFMDHNGRVYISRDVIFIEFNFPYKLMFAIS